MTGRFLMLGALCTLAAGCEAMLQEQTPLDGMPAPESVRALAAPQQNLDTARLREEDGCYWYLHEGPVEATLLPLRTPEGRPICARPATPDTPEALTTDA